MYILKSKTDSLGSYLTKVAFEEEALLALSMIVRDSGYAFTTVTPETHRRVTKRPFNPDVATLRDIFGWSRPFASSAVSSQILDLLTAANAVERNGSYWKSSVRFSTLDGLIFVHSAYPTVSADAVFFGPDTYRFANALQRSLDVFENTSIRRAVDIGSGAGPGGILVASAFPEAEVTLVDINEVALTFSRVNAASAKTLNIQTLNSNLLTGIGGSFDLIVSNPPYLIDGLARSYRHGGGPLGAALSLQIIEEATRRLSPGGTLILYTGAAIIDGIDAFQRAAEDCLRAAGMSWTYQEIDPDVFGEELENQSYAAADRIAAVLLTAKKPGDLNA